MTSSTPDRIKRVKSPDGRDLGVSFVCPGCGGIHHVYTQDTPKEVIGPRWTFDGNMKRPTLAPSINSIGIMDLQKEEPDDWDPKGICHSYVREGRIQFLPDCTHSKAGQTLDLHDIVT